MYGNLLYISGYYIDGKDGAAEHVREMCFHLAKLGWHATLIGIVRNSSAITHLANSNHRFQIVPVLSAKPEILTAFSLWQAVRQVLAQRTFDIAYIRLARKTIFATWWLRQARIPYVVEINTDIVGEYKSLGANFPTIILADLIERIHLNHASGAFCVTTELAHYVRRRTSHKIPVWVTGNGFRAEATRLATFDPTPRRAVNATEQETILVFLGTIQPWQGIDIVLEVLQKRHDLRLWIISADSGNTELEQKAKDLNVTSQIHWWGHKDGEELQTLLSASDIGIGSLALYRKRLCEAQPLKVRHYLSVGLPTIIGYKDTLLESNSIGVFYAQSPEELLARIEQIQKEGRMRDSTYRQMIRNFALQKLSWHAIAHHTSEILCAKFGKMTNNHQKSQ